MVIGVYSDRDSKVDSLMSTVDAFSASTVDVCSITTVNISPELKETADSYGITGGKMALINEITTVASDSDQVDPAVLAELTVAELEQTKTAAESGASLADAVAAATPDSEHTAAPANLTDPTAVVSETKPADTDSSSSDKKNESEDKSGVTSDTAIDNKEPASDASGNGSGNTVSGSTSVSAPASTDKNGISSSDKKKPEESGSNSDSDKKGETTSSESKGESTSSPSKGETVTSESKDQNSDQNTEDDSPDANTDLESVLPALPEEAQPVLPLTTDDEDSEIDTIGIPS
jgi:hypothetical protein